MIESICDLATQRCKDAEKYESLWRALDKQFDAREGQLRAEVAQLVKERDEAVNESESQVDLVRGLIKQRSDLLKEHNKQLAAEKARADALADALRILMSEFDDDADVIDCHPVASCSLCTSGTVPVKLDKGLCHFHLAEAALARHDARKL